MCMFPFSDPSPSCSSSLSHSSSSLRVWLQLNRCVMNSRWGGEEGIYYSASAHEEEMKEKKKVCVSMILDEYCEQQQPLNQTQRVTGQSNTHIYIYTYISYTAAEFLLLSFSSFSCCILSLSFLLFLSLDPFGLSLFCLFVEPREYQRTQCPH